MDKPSYNIKATEYITKLADTSEEIVDDETNDHNLRYIGANPNNYVSFNNELWRVIGVMNDVADENGVIEPRVKLIRSESIGSYAWSNGTYGDNDWSSDYSIRRVLNDKGAYYNRIKGTCPSGNYQNTVACDFSSNGLTEEYKRMIIKVKWKLGGFSATGGLLASSCYKYERGTSVYNGNPTEWIGEVGLIYQSDYGYATSGGATTNRDTCLSKSIANWSEASVSDCKANNWLNKSEVYWSITSCSSNKSNLYYADGSKKDGSYISSAIYPVIYLNSGTLITSGTGTESDPFILQ